MNEPILITGASGFVGGHIARGLSRRGFSIHSTGGSHECPFEVRTASDLTFELDIRNRENIRKALKESSPGIIIHAAALASPAACERNPALAREINVEGTRSFLSCVSELPGKSLWSPQVRV